MSQITRCPSCATSFKVVADQLRISEGWVRCGQCKEVFDAAAHLLPAPPPPLLPDVSLTDVRPPPAPVVRKPDTGRAWAGTAPVAPLPTAPAPSVTVPAAPLYAAQDFSLFPADPLDDAHAVVGVGLGVDAGAALASADAPDVPDITDTPEFPAVPEMPEQVLAVPDAAVPAFLAARSTTGQRQGDDLQLEPLTPFGWRTRQGAATQKAAGSATEAHALPAPAVLAPVPADPMPSAARIDVASASLPAAVVIGARSTPVGASEAAISPVPLVPAVPLPAGYELPFADLRDDEDPLDMPSFESTVPAELTSLGYPALELPIRPVTAPPAPVAPPGLAPSPEPHSDDVLAVPPSSSSAAAVQVQRAAQGLPSVEFDALPLQPVPPSPAGLALVEDDSPAAVLQAKPRKAPRAEADDDDDHDAEPHAEPHEEEVSFVVAARRKAFWRRPAVRAVLVVVVLLATLALALQVAVQERDRIAALDARARPWLTKLCVPLQCDIAPQRQIADVVIDSSSFNKARGDSYQLTLAMKSKASIALAMPAVELTLTDAQDQPVLRRVLLPADMGAPSELPARGEWSTAVSVVVTTGGARVAGYRLLAFYP